MAGVNKVILIGNLGRDPEVRTIEGGTKVASFSIATSEVFKNKDGSKNETTEWHNIVLWRGLAELAEKYLTKGKQVYIEGRLKTRQWDDKDGIKRYTTEIIGDNLTFLGGGGGGDKISISDAPTKESNNHNSPEPIQEADDDLPF